LVRSSALSEVAADDNEVRLLVMNALLNRLNETLVMRTEVQVRQVKQASHGALTHPGPPGSPQLTARVRRQSRRHHSPGNRGAA